MRCYLGIDVGTTALKIISAEYSGKIIAESYREYSLVHRNADWAEQDADQIWASLLASLEEISKKMSVSQRESIRAISLSTQRSTMVPVDGEGNPLRLAITWMDGRSIEQCTCLSSALGERAVYEETGNPVSTIWTFSYLLWLKKQEPSIFHEAACFANIHAFLMKRLGCEKFYLDYSNAGETMMFSPKEMSWSSKMLAYAGLEASRLPILVESGKIIGTLKKQLGDRFGFPEDVKLVSGGGDQQCAALGCSAMREGDIAIGMGTAANILALSDSLKFDRDGILIATPSAALSKWFLEGSLIACGPILNWVRNLAYRDLSADTVYKVMDQEASQLSLPGAHGVYILPHFQGAGCPYWNPQASGVFYGVHLTTIRADLVRAVMEGISYDVGKSLLLLERNGILPKRVFLTGGASKSDIWCQIQADVYNLPIIIPENPNVAAIGALILAICGAEGESSLEECIHNFVRIKKTYLPEEKRHFQYQKFMEYSDALYRAISSCQ